MDGAVPKKGRAGSRHPGPGGLGMQVGLAGSPRGEPRLTRVAEAPRVA